MGQMPAESIRVLIADDHPIVREGLETVINSQRDMRLVGQADNGREVVKLFRELNPDVVVMDLKMPDQNGLMAIEEIRSSGSETPILVLTSFSEDEMVISAIQLGANGVTLKDSPPEQLLNAIRDVVKGQSALHPKVVQRLMLEIRQPATKIPVDQLLTKRELDVIKCLAKGASNQEIAQTLSISTRTVTKHVQNILDKLGLENRTQAALYGVEHGIVDI